MKILLTGGGTGGHIFPLLGIWQELQNHKDIDCFWIGEKKSMEEKICSENNIYFHAIYAGKLRRYFSFQTFIDISKIPIGFLQSCIFIYKNKPDYIISKGGYVALPVVFAGWIFRIPILIHESDSIPGFTNVLSSYCASKIYTSFPTSHKFFPKNHQKKCKNIGLPLRKEYKDMFEKISTQNKKEQQEYKEQIWKSLTDIPYSSKYSILLIMGGSQGAASLNDVIKQYGNLLIKDMLIIHITGHNKKISIQNLHKKDSQKYVSYPFIKDSKKLIELFFLADICFMRASSAIFEAALFSNHLILVPLPLSGRDHQKHNAKYFTEKNAATMIEESDKWEIDAFHNLSTKSKINDIRKQNSLNIAKASIEATGIIIKDILKK
jgi:UDP-N-acetylglucosamine--N-acetylmuramyl-(pentapeptide) pyrophosphoryl-undecaprenol N-acetylglucosamine transferase